MQNGVFSNGDLRNIILPENTAYYYRIISKLIEFNIIERFSREYYITKDVKLSVLSQNICSDSYISFETVLAENLIIGSTPGQRVACDFGICPKQKILTIEIVKNNFFKYFF